ncbi:glycosyltransferase family 2 protein [Rathayibacter sp. AY1D9]|uniref:glycosyltransferase family 2 protein n=1 Tax=Rathayibacter sp. AY1D9 TaxID=2080548 RepID=UPI000CE810FD|nr:cellulose synthase catalytic subunit [Rathayibacter sp. AY1D9]PPH84177.1 glycosyl transferase family 2 [Rathayibacter sp. AY1D9]
MNPSTPARPGPPAPPEIRPLLTRQQRVASPRAVTSRAKQQSPSLIMIVLLSGAGALLYGAFLLNPRNIGDPLPFAIVIICELYLIGQAALTMWTALSSTYDPRDSAFHSVRATLYGSPVDGIPIGEDLYLGRRRITVDVFITTYREDPAIIEETARAARDMRGTHVTWLLDDGDDPQVAAIAERLGVRYVVREDRAGAKAGNVNHALRLTDSDFAVMIDADFVTVPEFLEETLPFFAHDDVAFVQAPQVYGNAHNFISRGSAYMQIVFYALTQPGKNKYNSAFCVGTNAVFRRKALDDIGGMYEGSQSEDIWTSIFVHERGWRSIFVPMTLAVGRTPETIEAFVRQQVRWAVGGFEILLKHNPFSPKRRLTTDQRVQYFMTVTFYFTGIVPLGLIVLPPLQIYLNITPVSLEVPLVEWILFYCGFYVLQIGLALFIIGSFRWETLLLSTVTFPMYTKAFFLALAGRKPAWTSTGATGQAASPFNFIKVQMVFLVFLAATSVVGFLKAEWTAEYSVALAWNVLNTLTLGAFAVIAAREHVLLKRAARAEVVAPSGPAAAGRHGLAVGAA